MKNAVYFLSILILFQSCFTYKPLDRKDYETVQPKKVRLKLENNEKIKGTIIKVKNDSIYLKGIVKITKISIDKVQKAQVREPDWLKSFALSYGIFISAGIIGLIALVNSL